MHSPRAGPPLVCRAAPPPRTPSTLSGDLRPGGRFQLEGNAGGDIRTCQSPHRLELTWEFGEAGTSFVSLQLAPAGDDMTELCLRHAVPDDDHWAQFGPGAVGVGWDLTLLGLAAFVAGEDLPPEADFMSNPLTLAFMRRSAAEWASAHQATGVSAEVARQAAERTSAAYAPESQPTPQ